MNEYHLKHLPAAMIWATLRRAVEMLEALLGPGTGVALLSKLDVLLVESLWDLFPLSCDGPECKTISCASPPNRPAILNEITC